MLHWAFHCGVALGIVTLRVRLFQYDGIIGAFIFVWQSIVVSVQDCKNRGGGVHPCQDRKIVQDLCLLVWLAN